MKKRILFVDDEPNVLQGLRRMLRPMRHEWETEFAHSGQEALQLLEDTSFDVVISDMRMPGMGGAELLATVEKRHPHVVRFILSGQSDQDMIIKSIGPAHQFISKPCDPDQLKTSINSALDLRNMLTDEKLQELVSRLKSLPSLPSLYLRIVEVMKSPDFTLKEVGEIISEDIGMTAKMLQLVNSSFFGVGVHVADPIHAARLLGAEILKALVLSVQIFSQFDNAESSGLSLDTFSNHSMIVASLAKKIALSEDAEKNLVDDSFIAGMLHDAGKLILAENLPDEYRETMSRVECSGIAPTKAEFEIFGATHAEVGAYLLGIWGLPNAIVEAVAYHHTPGKYPHQEVTCLTAVHVADGLIREQELDDGEEVCNIDYDYIEKLGLSEQLNEWRTLCEENKPEAEKS